VGKTGFEAKQFAIEPAETLIEGGSAIISEDGCIAREIGEQASLTIQQTVCHA
jgi:hypothetical protein